jgi:S-DNA-T family DNA segregation ATPase FtsK/SpoIIIE
VGVLITILALALLAILASPEEAFGSSLVAGFLRLACGAGAMLLPFLLFAWAVSFFIQHRLTVSTLRFVIALGLIFLAIISILGILTPQAAGDPGQVFNPNILPYQGGYVGGSVAWALLSVFGMTVSLILLVGLIVVGLVLVGLSISSLVEKVSTTIRFRRHKGSDAAVLATDDKANGGVAGAYQLGPAGVDVLSKSPQGAWAQVAGNPQMLPTKLYNQARLAPTLPVAGAGPSNRSPETAEDVSPTDLGATRRIKGRWAAFADLDDDRVADPIGSRALNGAEVAAGTQVPIDGKTAATDADAGAASDSADRDQQDGLLSSTNSDVTSAGAHSGKNPVGKSSKQAGSASDPSAVMAFAPAVAQHDFCLPDGKLLKVSREKANTKAGASELRTTANHLQETLEEFGVDGSVVGWIAGPTVTLYKVSLGEGVRLNRVTALQADIQLALAAEAIRIVAPIPGTSLVGIEVPNQSRNVVLLGDVLAAARSGPLALAIGKDVEGGSIVADLSTMPHLLIGGTTGSGKSVAINSIIMSILMRTTPDEVRMIMIDPKRVELTLYNGIPHLYVPVVTDAGQAASALAWCVAEMDRRLKLFEKHAVKNIKQFNAKVTANLERLAKEFAKKQALDQAETATPAAGDTNKRAAHDDDQAAHAARSGSEDTVTDRESCQTTSDGEVDITVEQEQLRARLPYIVIVIDELADLMMLNGKEVEATVSRLAQLARAAGLHLIVATQRPSTNVITGLIKANIVNRIAFTVASGIDSRVILDSPGAEDLIGLGDLLFSRPEYSKPVRIQGCFVSEPEIELVVNFWRSQGSPDYNEAILLMQTAVSATAGGGAAEDFGVDDPLLWEAAEIVVSAQLGSTSTLQRRLKVGYARAGRIMDMLEMKGIVGPPNGSKPREVLVDDVLDLETLRAFE